jgi:hypothetical protein
MKPQDKSPKAAHAAVFEGLTGRIALIDRQRRHLISSGAAIAFASALKSNAEQEQQRKFSFIICTY